MMKIKNTDNSKKIQKKYLVPLLLLFALIIIGVCITFAWFLNIINIDGMDMHTGNFKYEFTGFYKNANGVLQEDFTLSTENPNSEAIQKEALTATTQASTLISPLENGVGEIYYVIKKLPDSVDLALSINFIAAVQDMEEIGGFWYEIETVKGISNGETPAQIVESSKEQMTNISEITGNERVIYNIGTDIRKEVLSEDDYWCFRLTYGLKSNAISPAYIGDTLYIYPVLCVAQVGGLPNDIGNKEPIKVRSAGELERALSTYTVGQEIQILNDVTYEGDLIFNRPVTLKPWGAKLTVIGDLRYTYAGAGQFYINTSQNGFLEVLHVEGTASGGNIYIEMPNAGMSFIGKNDKDIVVDGDILAEASYNVGLFISKSRLEDRSGNLKIIYLRGRTFLDIDYQTHIREVGVYDAPLYSVRIVNNGTIGTVRLNNMANSSAPPSNIQIENHSIIENSIILPSWSKPYKEDGNTRVIVHQSAGGTTTISTTTGSVFQTADIEHEAQELLVEKEENNENHITVHYMNDLNGNRRSLAEIITEYQEKTDDKKIPESAMITYMKIQCYGDVVMTSADYAFIRNNMTSLVMLDLSKAASENLKVPNYAFNGSMTKLETVYMSETDTAWGDNIFGNTDVIDIKIPLLAVNMANNTFRKSETETVKYIHVQQATAKLTLPSDSYIFVPDEGTVSMYASGNAKVFVEATLFTSEYGDFFLRMLGGTCVFVTYAGDANDWYNAFKSVTPVTLDNAPDGSVRSYLRIDMSSVKVSLGEQIISSIDGYAFYNRFKLENASNINERYYIDFGGVITSIGDYAFTNCDMIVGVEGTAVNYLGECAFNNCSKLVKMVFPSLTAITVKNVHAVNNCNALQWVETGVMDKAINDSQAKAFANSLPNAKIHIVHSTGEEVLEIVKRHNLISSGPSQNIYAFIPKNVYSVYANIGNYRILNINDCEISFYPEIMSTNIYEVPKFAVSTNSESEKELLICIADRLEAESVFADYPDGVSKIGANAFRYVTIHSETPASSLRIPDCVTHIEPYAFHNTSNKNYHTLELNNVVSVEHYAFENNRMIAIKGENVEWLGDCAFQGAKAYTVELPSWRYGYAQVHAYGYYFQACPNLRYAYVGPCDNIRNWAFYNCPELTSVFIDAKNRGGNTTKIPDLGWWTDLETYNAFVSGGKSVLADHTDLENVVDDFGDFIFADPITITATVDNVSGTIIIPQSVCVKNDDGTLTYQKSLSERISGDYTTPEYIYKLEQTMYFLGEERDVYTVDPTAGGVSAGIFTKIGTNAYYGVGFDASAKITIAPSVRSIGKTAFKKCNVAEVDLVNVEEIGSNCFQAAQFNKITALNLKKLNGSCFVSCANLTNLYLPNFEILSGSSPFSSSGLVSITLGKNTKNLGSNMFSGCSNLVSVVIQALEVPTASNPFPDTIIPNITLSVRKSAQYITGTSTSWQKVPIEQISYFDNITNINGADFYWDIIDEDKKTVEIIMILFPDTWQVPADGKFVIPSTITHTVLGAEGEEDITTVYTVISVSEATIIAITAKFYYTSLTLPYALQTIEFSQSVLSPALEEFVIGEAVQGYTPMFTVSNGVLYNADGRILLIYPQGKQDASYTVSDSVTTIAKEAFFSANFSEIIIEGTVIIMDNAFESCSQLQSVTFSNLEENKISMFVGHDIFKSCYAINKIYVPESKLEQYIQSVIYDRAIANRFAKIETESFAE